MCHVNISKEMDCWYLIISNLAKDKMIKINCDRMVTTTSHSMTCHLGQKSTTRCGPHNSNSQVQTLDELDAASMRVPGKQMKIR